MAAVDPTYCAHCGQGARSMDHAACRQALQLEPPRYCGDCRRRLVVQVTPDGWSARCIEHGTTSGSTWAG